MKLKENEALALIIYRRPGDSPNYVVSVRQFDARLDGGGDFIIESPQSSVLNLQHEPDALKALQQAISKMKEFEP